MRAAEYCGHQVTALKKYQDDESCLMIKDQM